MRDPDAARPGVSSPYAQIRLNGLWTPGSYRAALAENERQAVDVCGMPNREPRAPRVSLSNHVATVVPLSRPSTRSGLGERVRGALVLVLAIAM